MDVLHNLICWWWGLVAKSCPTLLWPHGLSPRLLSPCDFPGKDTGVGCPFLFQEIFLTQGSSPHLLCLLHWQPESLALSPMKANLFIYVYKCMDWGKELWVCVCACYSMKSYQGFVSLCGRTSVFPLAYGFPHGQHVLNFTRGSKLLSEAAVVAADNLSGLWVPSLSMFPSLVTPPCKILSVSLLQGWRTNSLVSQVLHPLAILSRVSSYLSLVLKLIPDTVSVIFLA